MKAIDAKMTFDNNALYRHPDVAELNEPTEDEKKELYAKSKGFSYVNLGGNIGCMVNGLRIGYGYDGHDQGSMEAILPIFWTSVAVPTLRRSWMR